MKRSQDVALDTGGKYHVIAGGAPVAVLNYFGTVTIEQGIYRYSAPVREWADLAEMAMVHQAEQKKHAALMDDLLADDPGPIDAPAPAVEVTGPDPSTVKLRYELVQLLATFRGTDARVRGLVEDAALLERYILRGETDAPEEGSR